MTDKTTLRRQLLFMAETRMPCFNATHAHDLAHRVMALITDLDVMPRVIALYHPLPDEVDSRPLATLLRQHAYELALPLMIAKDRPLSFRIWRAGDKLDKTSYGLAQPTWAAPEVTPDLVITPILGFQGENYRLGRGGGSYDRTLDTAAVPVTIGVAASFQQVEFMPEPHDRPLDHIVTEQTIYSRQTLC